jgi:hypothetical protein
MGLHRWKVTLMYIRCMQMECGKTPKTSQLSFWLVEYFVWTPWSERSCTKYVLCLKVWRISRYVTPSCIMKQFFVVFWTCVLCEWREGERHRVSVSLHCDQDPVQCREDLRVYRNVTMDLKQEVERHLQTCFLFDVHLSEVAVIWCGKSTQFDCTTFQERHISAYVYFWQSTGRIAMSITYEKLKTRK